MTRISKTFVLASAGVEVGDDFLGAIREVPNHYGGKGAPNHTIRAWMKEGLVDMLTVRVNDGKKQLVVRLTEKGAAARDAKVAADAKAIRAAEMVMARRIAREIEAEGGEA